MLVFHELTEPYGTPKVECITSASCSSCYYFAHVPICESREPLAAQQQHQHGTANFSGSIPLSTFTDAAILPC